MTLVQDIQRFNAGRDPQMLALKYRNMRSGAFVFLRATCHLYYQALSALPPLASPGPLAWVCGDLHLENFGTYRGDNGLVYFDINDFDEAALAPASWDAVRLLSSVLVGRESLKADASEAQALCAFFLQSYAAALQDGKARWVEREVAQEPVRSLLQELQHRTRQDLLDKRTALHGRERRIKLGRRALAVDAQTRQQVSDFMAGFAATQPEPDRFEVLDVARRIAGNGSLGLTRYVVLARGKGDPNENLLLDLKQATASSLQPHTPAPQPAWGQEAQRIVSLQQRMQAIAPAFLHPVVHAGASFILRELQPTEDRVALAEDVPDLDRARSLMAIMAQCLAWAQLRASGRQGSAPADDLIAWAGDTRWQAPLLAAAQELADTVQAQWLNYSQAYDQGAFGSPPDASDSE